MRRAIISSIFFIVVACEAVASPLPLTAKEISLMLRSGYSSDAVLHELAARHFANVFDAATESELLKAGASQALVDALRSGAYQSSGQEMDAAKQRLAAQQSAKSTLERSPDAGNSRPASSAATAATYQQAGGTMYDHFKDDLVYWHEGSLVPFDDEALQKKKFYLLFFSGFWSKEGRQFTSRLIDYYNRERPRHPEIEVVFFSVDRSAYAMENYISQTNMPWPALAFDKRNGKAGAIQGNLVHHIPQLILADASGKILSDSGDDPAGLDKVLADTDKVLAEK